MNIEKFFKRINYHGPQEPTLAVLTALQHHFLRAVPFENLDIHRNIPLNYRPGPIYHKIVEQQRGGICFECNGLLYDVLTTLGFQVDLLSAKMFSEGQPLSRFTHVTLIVHLTDDDYLVDVGNGKAFGPPLPIKRPTISRGEGTVYSIGSYEDYLALTFRDETGAWQPRYIYSPTAQPRDGFTEACHYIQTSPQAIFTQKKIVSRLTEAGRITLTDMTYIRTTEEGRQEVELTSEKVYHQVLAQDFGIVF